MELFLIILLIVCGFLLIVFGGDIFVDSAIWIAEKARIPKLLIGATIVSIGTTLPEITVSILAAVAGDTGLAISNATGSMFANLTLILGIGLSFLTLAVQRKKYMEKFIFSIFNILLLIIFISDGYIALYESVLLLILFTSFMAVNIVQAVKENRKSVVLPFTATYKESIPDNLHIQQTAIHVPQPGSAKTQDNVLKKEKPAWLMIALFVIGAAAIGFGAQFLVDNISKLAVNYLGISTVLVGATVVALGTSLPELITAINSIKRKNIEMSFGNVLGANIINGTFLVGISGALQGNNGINVAMGGDLTIILSIVGFLIGLLVLILPIACKGKTYRFQGWCLVGLYSAYIVYLVVAAFI